jgi:hypothetical protein
MEFIIRRKSEKVDINRDVIVDDDIFAIEVIINGTIYTVTESAGVLEVRTGRHALSVAHVASNAVRVRVE